LLLVPATGGTFLVRRRRPPASYHDAERAEYTFYISYLRSGMVVFDVGANVGELTTLFSHFVTPAGSVHAFEPVDQAYERLQAVVAVLGRSNVVLNKIAVAERTESIVLNLYDEEHLSWNTVASRPMRKGGADVLPVARREVPAVSLDDYCDERAIDRIDLLKIDVEGAELDVLHGSERLLRARAIRCCVFEFGATTLEYGVDPSAISTYLGSCGYSLRNLVERDPVFPGGDSVETAAFSMHVAMPR